MATGIDIEFCLAYSKNRWCIRLLIKEKEMIFENYDGIAPEFFDDIDDYEFESDYGYQRDYPNPADY